MAFSLERGDVDRLFAQHGIAPTAIEGSSTAAAAAGGRVATIAVRRTEDGSVISLTMGEAHVECSCPPDEAQAASLVTALQTLQKLPAGDAGFDRMLVDLLVKV